MQTQSPLQQTQNNSIQQIDNTNVPLHQRFQQHNANIMKIQQKQNTPLSNKPNLQLHQLLQQNKQVPNQQTENKNGPIKSNTNVPLHQLLHQQNNKHNPPQPTNKPPPVANNPTIPIPIPKHKTVHIFA